MKRPRSPRFPFIPLPKAIKDLAAIHQAGCVSSFRPMEAMKALGFASMHGRAVKVFAAFRAYDLIDKSGGAAEDERLFSITESGLNLISPENEEVKLAFLRKAALSPLMFRMLWQNGRGRSEEEIEEVLLKRGFTEEGAKRAAVVFTRNRKVAKLNELEELPAGLPERAPKNSMEPETHKERRQRNPNRPEMARGLNLPLSTGQAIVPVGISEEEFQLLIQTLRLWKNRLVKSAS